MNRLYPVFSLILLGVGGGFYFYHLDVHSFWGDELQTAHIVALRTQSDLWFSKNPASMEEYFQYGFLAPYYSLNKIWCALFGISPTTLRSFSAFCAGIGLILILRYGPDTLKLGRKVAFGAGIIYLLSPMMLWYAQEARYYAMLQPLVLLLCILYYLYWDQDRCLYLFSWSLLSVFTLMTHPFAIFPLAALGIYGGWRWHEKKYSQKTRVILCHSIVLSGFLLILKPLLVSHHRVSEFENYSIPTDELLPWKAFSNFLCGVYDHPSPFLALILLTATTVVLVLSLHDEGKKDPFRFWAIVCLGTCFLMIAVSMDRPILVDGKKYVMIFFSPFCVCLAYALLKRSSKIVPLSFLGVLALQSGMAFWNYYESPQKQNWKQAVQLIAQHAREGDVCIQQSAWRGYALELYKQPHIERVRKVLWKPSEISQSVPSPISEARRVWIIKTGGIAQSYAAKLEEIGFRTTFIQKLPSGSHFMTYVWLLEKDFPSS